jgi:hypothetical protein
LIAVAASLLVVCGCLLAIGDPPAIRHDALWVNEHRGTVRLAIATLAVAIVATIGAASESRYRLPASLLWLAAVLAAWRWFSDAIEIIARVVINRAG